MNYRIKTDEREEEAALLREERRKEERHRAIDTERSLEHEESSNPQDGEEQ